MAGEHTPRVDLHDALDAYEWAGVVARAVADAPNEITREFRERRAKEQEVAGLNEILALIQKPA